MRSGRTGNRWHSEETYKGLIQIAMEALKFPVLVNGGAVIALLAFLGKDNRTAMSLGSVNISMCLFIGGVFLGGLAYLAAYLTQLRLYGESALDVPQSGPLRHNVFLSLTFVLMLSSIIAFAFGAWIGASAMQPLPPDNSPKPTPLCGAV